MEIKASLLNKPPLSNKPSAPPPPFLGEES